MSNPYLVYINSKIIDPQLGEASYNEWYQKFHIPDILKSGSVAKAGWYRALQPENERPWLAIYDCRDFEFMTDPERLNAIPKIHALLTEGKKVWEVASFDMRHYELMGPKYESESTPGLYPFLIVVTVDFQYQEEAGFDKWYAHEHLELLSKQPSYGRSRRYVSHSSRPNPDIPTYLILDEFDSSLLPSTKEGLPPADPDWLRNLAVIKHVKDVKLYQKDTKYS